MSEIKKNIETCRGEDVLAEVSAAPQDPHFGSLVNEALDPLKQQALHQAGYDGYSEVIEQHKPYTFASAIIQMKSNLLLLLRALWQFPFGSGTRSLSDDASLRSLSDMWSHYITRLSGNPEHGIPSRLSSLTDLPSAPLLVADRKISGVPDAPDGISLVQLLGDNTITTEELTDDTTGWVLRRAIPALTGLKKVTLGCKSMPICSLDPFANNSGIEEGYFPELEALDNRTYEGSNVTQMFTGSNLKKLSFPKLTTLHCNNMNGAGYFRYITGHCEILMPNCTYVVTQIYTPRVFTGCSGVWKLVLGKLEQVSYLFSSGGGYTGSEFTNLIHFEIGEGTAINLPFGDWNPTNALDASLDTLVTDEDCHNNLEQFLKNFRTYIALRLADNGSGKTLTLSAAVFSSIWDANGNPQVLRDGLDQLRADVHYIIKTTKHWDVNKAN